MRKFSISLSMRKFSMEKIANIYEEEKGKYQMQCRRFIGKVNLGYKKVKKRNNSPN